MLVKRSGLKKFESMKICSEKQIINTDTRNVLNIT